MPDPFANARHPSAPRAPAAPEGRQRATGSVKGTLLLARLRFLEGQGKDVAERVLKRLPASDQAVVRGMVLPSGWYPADLLLRLEMTAVALLASGDRRSLFVDMGRFSAATNLGPTGVQRFFLREGDPHVVLRNVPRMYESQHSVGRRSYERTSTGSATIRTFDAADPSLEDCLTAVGWLQHAVELSGGREVRVVERQCAARGAPCCEYECSWK